MDYFEVLVMKTSRAQISNLANNWWIHFYMDPIRSLNDFGLCIINSGGLFQVSVCIDNLEMSSLLTHIFNETASISNPSIFNKSFCQRLILFIDYILTKDSWQIFSYQNELKLIISLIKLLKMSKWTPIRAAAYITGIRIMTQCWRCIYDTTDLKSVTSQERSNVAAEIKDIIFKEIFVYNFRDRVGHIRRIPLIEFRLWFIENPDIIMNDLFFKYINRGLNDPVCYNKATVLELIYDIFSSEVSLSKQEEMFEQLRPSLLDLLRSKYSKIPVYSLKIINSARRNLNILLTPSEEEFIFMALYDRRKALVKEAKVYINDVYLRRDHSLSNIIKTINNCPVKSSKMFIEHFFEFFITKYSWNNWINALLSCSDDDLNNLIDFLYEFISLMFKKNSEMLEEANDIIFNNIVQMKESISSHFKSVWFVLATEENLQAQSSLLPSIVKLFQFLDFKCLTDSEQMDAINALVKAFNDTQCCRVLKECSTIFKTHSDLKKSRHFSTIMKDLSLYYSSLITELANDLSSSKNDFSQTTLKIVLLFKSSYFNSSDLWMSLSSSKENYISSDKVEYILTIMYHMIMNDRVYYVDCKVNTIAQSRVLLKTNEPLYIVEWRVKSRIQTLLEFCLCVLKENSFETQQYKASNIFGELLHNFGKHTAQSEALSGLTYEIKDIDIQSFMEHCSGYMFKECEKVGNICCLTIKYCLDLMTEGVVCVSYLKYFFQHIGSITEHSTITFHSLRSLNNISVYAQPIVNGFIMFFNTKHNHETINSLSAELKNKMELIAQKLSPSKKQNQLLCLNLLLYIQNLIRRGYTVFSGVLQAVEASLPNEVLTELHKV